MIRGRQYFLLISKHRYISLPFLTHPIHPSINFKMDFRLSIMLILNIGPFLKIACF